MRILLALAALLVLPNAASAYLPLPPGQVALGTPAGETMFLEASARAAYWPLSAHYETQQNQAFCGVASLVMVLNASAVPAPPAPGFSPYRFFTQNNVFDPEGATNLRPGWVGHHGLTLDQLGALAAQEGLKVRITHATPDGLARFRAEAAKALATPNRHVLVNFDRATLGEQGGGHISPLAAYDAKTDRFLLLDVARYKYPPSWITAKNLYAAMATVDTANDKRYRGFLILTAP